MASLLKAIKNWGRKRRDDAANALADPVRDGKFAIEDSEKQITQFESQVARLMAENKRIKRNKIEADADVKKFGRSAENALKAGNETAALTLIESQTNAQKIAKQFGAEIKKNQQLIDKLRNQLNKARSKVAQAKSNHVSLSARHEAAKVRKELAQASSGFGEGGPLSALEDLQNAVDADESEAEAYEELAGEQTSEDDLVEQFSGGGSDDAQTKLDALKAKLGK